MFNSRNDNYNNNNTNNKNNNKCNNNHKTIYNSYDNNKNDNSYNNTNNVKCCIKPQRHNHLLRKNPYFYIQWVKPHNANSSFNTNLYFQTRLGSNMSTFESYHEANMYV